MKNKYTISKETDRQGEREERSPFLIIDYLPLWTIQESFSVNCKKKLHLQLDIYSFFRYLDQFAILDNLKHSEL